MSSVTGVSSYNYGTSTSGSSGTQRLQRPDPAAMAENLFSRLDTSGKGYIEQSDLASALSALSSSSSSASTSSSASASEIFSQLDSNGDGKVTQDELSTRIKKLAEALDNQFNQARIEGGMPPPPPAGTEGDETGFTQDELSSQLSEIGSSDSTRSGLISKIVENFAAADTNEDGKVSFLEAMTYDQANRSTASRSTDTSSASTNASAETLNRSEKTEAQVFRQLMALMRSYGNEGQSSLNTVSSLISTSA